MLAYTDTGEGKPILFIHGLGGRKEAWQAQLEIASTHRLICVDLRGHGETELDVGLTLRNFASDVAELLTYLNVKSAHICGLSLGGIVALELYRQRPDLVAGLILANTTAFIPHFASFGLSESERAHRDGTLIDVILARGFYDKSRREEARHAFKIRGSYMESAHAAVGANYLPMLYGIRKPTLLIGSANDAVTPVVGNLSAMQFFMPRAKTVIFERTGHLSNIERASEFNACLRDFVR